MEKSVETDEFLALALSMTEQLVDSLKEENLFATGKILDSRSSLIGRMKEAGVAGPFSERQRDCLLKIEELNRQADRFAVRFRGSIQKKMEDSGRIRDGLIAYNKARYNFSSGQIVDKKR